MEEINGNYKKKSNVLLKSSRDACQFSTFGTQQLIAGKYWNQPLLGKAVKMANFQKEL